MKIKMFLTLLTVTAAAVLSAAENRILVTYYSWGGNTKFAAETIAAAVNGTLWEITPVKPYTRNYKACVAQARKEIKAGYKPELAKLPDVSKYDIIFVGTPNWCGTMAPPVAGLLSRVDLKGKKVFLFVTHGRGGMQNCDRDFRAAVKGAEIGESANFYGARVKKDAGKIAAWAKKSAAR